MLRIALASLFMILLTTGTARACDLHGEADNSFLAYIDYRGMNEAQQRQAEQRAIDQFHEQQMQVAKTKFLSRFKVSETPNDPKVARLN